MSEKKKVVSCFWDKERECPFPRISDELGRLRSPLNDTMRFCQLCLMAAIAKELYWLRETRRRLGR